MKTIAKKIDRVKREWPAHAARATLALITGLMFLAVLGR